jgi:hypothetical protein
MLDNALCKWISEGCSSRRVALSRPSLGSVGVKIGVKGRSQICGFQYTGMSLAITTGVTESPGMCTSSWLAKHCPTPDHSPARQQTSKRPEAS